jgi:hypothetical protein
MALGNSPPHIVAQTERIVWKSVVGIMLGSDGLTELKMFVNEYQSLVGNVSALELKLDWFSTKSRLYFYLTFSDITELFQILC